MVNETERRLPSLASARRGGSNGGGRSVKKPRARCFISKKKPNGRSRRALGGLRPPSWHPPACPRRCPPRPTVNAPRPLCTHPVTLAPPGAMAEKRIIVELEEGWSFMEARGREAGDARAPLTPFAPANSEGSPSSETSWRTWRGRLPSRRRRMCTSTRASQPGCLAGDRGLASRPVACAPAGELGPASPTWSARIRWSEARGAQPAPLAGRSGSAAQRARSVNPTAAPWRPLWSHASPRSRSGRRVPAEWRRRARDFRVWAAPPRPRSFAPLSDSPAPPPCPPPGLFTTCAPRSRPTTTATGCTSATARR